MDPGDRMIIQYHVAVLIFPQRELVLHPSDKNTKKQMLKPQTELSLLY